MKDRSEKYLKKEHYKKKGLTHSVKYCGVVKQDKNKKVGFSNLR
jgi:hypothetical protein